MTKTCWQCRGCGGGRFTTPGGKCGVCFDTLSVPDNYNPQDRPLNEDQLQRAKTTMAAHAEHQATVIEATRQCYRDFGWITKAFVVNVPASGLWTMVYENP